MRGALHFFAAVLVAGVAFWAYRVNYAAQEALERVSALRTEIARERDAIRVLRAEWAWLNAPDRLQRLVTRHAEPLGLEPLAGARFAGFEEFAPPAPDEALRAPGEVGR